MQPTPEPKIHKSLIERFPEIREHYFLSETNEIAGDYNNRVLRALYFPISLKGVDPKSINESNLSTRRDEFLKALSELQTYSDYMGEVVLKLIHSLPSGKNATIRDLTSQVNKNHIKAIDTLAGELQALAKSYDPLVGIDPNLLVKKFNQLLCIIAGKDPDKTLLASANYGAEFAMLVGPKKV
ncbi:MAG: hypothetical protein KDD56_02355 [Bdellovibrionales bacterium]|nr:hypothetical protein [Bdellovibrionales bacterium]